MIKFLDLYSQYTSIRSEIDAAICNVIRDTAFIGGKYVHEFERQFSSYLQVKHCVGAGNGTDALEIAIEAAQLPPGSEVMVPGNSFIASAEAVTRSGHKVVFVDVDPDCYTISIDDVSRKITKRTAAVIAVHLYGHPCDMDPLLEICNERGIFLLEDCAQAHGAQYKGKSVGSIGHMAAFSFYPGKNLGAYGDGGAITTNDDELAKRARMIANHGRIEKYAHEVEGRNSRLDGLQAAVLSVKLRHLEKWTQKRIEIAEYYIKHLAELDQIILPHRKKWAKQVYHLFVIRANERDELRAHLSEMQIETGVHYPVALPKLNAYSYLNMAKYDTFYNAADSTLLSLPMGEHLSLTDADTVISAIKEFFA